MTFYTDYTDYGNENLIMMEDDSDGEEIEGDESDMDLDEDADDMSDDEEM